ncbi:MAG: carbohydrate-binding protein, partial [Conexivisphaera sp.]
NASNITTGELPYAQHAGVIQGAINSSGNVLNLGGTAAASITPIAGLMPAQAGADVTALNSASSTIGGTIYQKASTYTTSNPFNLALASLVNDSANGSLWGNVATFTAGWACQTPINFGTGFSAITYDVYVRIRSNGAGNSPTSCVFGIYTGYSGGQYPISVGLTVGTAYAEVYAGQVVFTQAQLSYGLITYFSTSGITTQYYVDYVRFTPTIQHLAGVPTTAITPIAGLMPAQAGADVTAQHTSALTASLSNQTLDGLPDGSTYARPLSTYLRSGVPYTFKGAWAASTAYNVGDEVQINSTYFVCTTAHTSGSSFSGTDWQFVGTANASNITTGELPYAQHAGVIQGAINS